MQDTLSFDQLADKIDVPRHIIHLWTKKFPILNPQRSTSGKIGFKNRDISLSQGLKQLLILDKKSIKEVQTLINERGVNHIIDIGKNTLSKNSSSEANKKISQRSIADQAFNRLNNIFSRDKKKPIHIIKTDPLLSKSNSVISETPSTNQNLHTVPEISTPQNDINEKTTSGASFEDNWRDLMQKEGKVPTIEATKSSSQLSDIIDNNFLPDAWMIEDEINLFDVEPNEHTPAIMTHVLNELSKTDDTSLTNETTTNNHQHSAYSAVPKENMVVTNEPTLNHSLSIAQKEKIQHLIAKLDIMHDEMIIASDIISQTLKAFGYSGFENAYNKFDQKSAY